MIIEFDFAYRARGVLKGKRSTTDFLVRERVAIDILEIDPADFPLVCEMPPQALGQDRLPNTEVRKSGAEFFGQSYFSTQHDGIERTLSKEEFVKLIDAWEEPRGIPSFWHTAARYLTRTLEDVKNIEESEREETLASLVQVANSFAIAGDQVFNVCGEPVLAYSYLLNDEGRLLPTINLITLDPKVGLSRLASYSRADRVHDLIDTIVLARHPISDSEKEAIVGRIPEVVRPDLLEFDDEGVKLLNAAANLLSDGLPKLAQAPVSFMMAWGELRDVLTAVNSGEMGADNLASFGQSLADEFEMAGLEGENFRAWGHSVQRWNEHLENLHQEDTALVF